MLVHSPLNPTINRMVSSPASAQLANSKFKPIINSSQRVEFSRRIVFPLLISVAAVPDASESQKALLQGKWHINLQYFVINKMSIKVSYVNMLMLPNCNLFTEYLKRSKENKAKYDKEVSNLFLVFGKKIQVY